MRLFKPKKMITIPMNTLKKTEGADISSVDKTKNQPGRNNLK